VTTKLQVEALLFSSGKTMSEEQLAALTKLDPRTVKKALADLKADYDVRDSAIVIFNDDTGWKMMVRELYVSTVKNIVAETELTRACMETLAVIAYKYPKAVQSEVIDIRGGGAYEHMSELERLGFIVREPSGRSYLVKLTERFFNYFEVKGGQDIRQVFKNVKVPLPVKVEGQKTLGGLEVIDVTHEQGQAGPHVKVVDGLEVVEVSPAQEVPVVDGVSATDDIQGDATVEDAVPSEKEDGAHQEFLDDLDARIAKLAARNDVNDKDESLKRRPLPGQEEVFGSMGVASSDVDEKKEDETEDETKEKKEE